MTCSTCPGKTDCLEEWSYYEPGTSPSSGNVQDELDKDPGPESPMVIAEYPHKRNFVFLSRSPGWDVPGRDTQRETLGLHLGEGWGSDRLAGAKEEEL